MNDPSEGLEDHQTNNKVKMTHFLTKCGKYLQELTPKRFPHSNLGIYLADKEENGEETDDDAADRHADADADGDEQVNFE